MKRSIRKRMPGSGSAGRSLSLAGSAGSSTFSMALPTLSGSTVNEHSALTITAVWNAVNIYANTIAALDLYVAEQGPAGGHTAAVDHPAYDLVHARPNPISTSFRFRQSLVAHALTHGNGYAEIETGRGGRPRFLHLLDPRNVTPRVEDDGTLWYHLERDAVVLPASRVVHVAGLGWDGVRGYSPITVARESLGLALAQEKWSSALYGNNAQPSGYLEIPGNPDAEAVTRATSNWNKKHQGTENAGKTAALTGGMKWVQTSFSPEDAQLILSKNFSVAEVGRLFNLPQYMLGNLDKGTFSNIEQLGIQFYRLSLMPWLVSIEAELNLKLFTRAERRTFSVRHNVADLLRGDSAAITAQDTADFNSGVKSVNEIRLGRGLSPLDTPNADKHFVPTNNLTALEDLGQVAPVPVATLDPDDATTPLTEQAPVDDAPAPLAPGELDSARTSARATDLVDAALESLA